MDLLDIDSPALALEQGANPAIATAHAPLTHRFDPELEVGLFGVTGAPINGSLRSVFAILKNLSNEGIFCREAAMDLDRAIKRQALAEWRDVQIIGAATQVNLAATEAKAAFEEQLVDEALRESLFAPTEWASERIDVLMYAALKPHLDIFLGAAAEDLLEIDPVLESIAEALKRDDVLALPTPLIANERPQDESTNQALAEASEGVAAQAGLGWLTRIGGRVATGATGLATTATAAVNTVSPERLKQRTRLRAAAGQRIDDLWMGQGGDPKAVQSQVIALIDQVAFSARTSLS